MPQLFSFKSKTLTAHQELIELERKLKDIEKQIGYYRSFKDFRYFDTDSSSAGLLLLTDIACLISVITMMTIYLINEYSSKTNNSKLYQEHMTEEDWQYLVQTINALTNSTCNSGIMSQVKDELCENFSDVYHNCYVPDRLGIANNECDRIVADEFKPKWRQLELQQEMANSIATQEKIELPMIVLSSFLGIQLLWLCCIDPCLSVVAENKLDGLYERMRNSKQRIKELNEIVTSEHSLLELGSAPQSNTVPADIKNTLTFT